MRRLGVLPVGASVLLLVLTRPVAGAAWSAVGLGGGAAKASYALAAPPPTPSEVAGGVFLFWPANGLIDAYRVRRFDASGSPQIPSGACAVDIAGGSCLDSPAPTGTWTYALTTLRGSWTGSQGPRSTPVVVTRRDTTPPVISATGLLRSGGTSIGYLRPAGTYRLYATVSDSESGASGIASVSADASQFTVGASATSMSAVGGPWTIGSSTFTHRSAELTATASLANGTNVGYAIYATDVAGNVALSSGSASIDSISPTAQDVQTMNAGIAGKAEAGDSVVFTFSEPVDPSSLVAGWNGSNASQVIVRITDGGSGNDVLTVWNPTNTQTIPIGNLSLERSDYVSGTVTFGSSGVQSRISVSGSTVTVTLGTPDIAARLSSGTGSANMSWLPSGNATDRAGNACSTITRVEGGSRDREF